MLKYDSQHGQFKGTIEVGSDHLVVRNLSSSCPTSLGLSEIREEDGWVV